MAQATQTGVAGVPSTELFCQDPNLKPEKSTENSEEWKTKFICYSAVYSLPLRAPGQSDCERGSCIRRLPAS